MFSVDHLNVLRSNEIENIARHLRPAGARVLEVGAGTGQQAVELTRRGFHIEAIEIPCSNYAQDRMFPIVDFDGRHIPFPDASFDVVFSSNVLEHVPDLVQMHREIKRVLKPTGYALHVLPTHAWRFWTTLSAFPTAVQYAGTIGDQLKPRWPPSLAEIRRLAGAWYPAGRHLIAPFGQRRHGERGNIISETWLFHPNWWRRNFFANGFEIIKDEPMGLFYTGNMTFNTRLTLERRAMLSHVLGSACHLFEIKSRESHVPAIPTSTGD
jgi:ubiquinone/menaquinone biosynthesis C-methylase UbiE